MAAPAVNVLVESLQRFGLLDEPKLEEVASKLQREFPDAQALAVELVKRGWLTSFQAKQVLEGRGQHLIFGAYVILERLGTGGNGQVFKAWNRTLDRPVALKVLRKDLVADAEAVGRFLREVEVLNHVSHPSVVQAYDAGVVGVTHFLAMEYVEGIDLDRMVRKSGPLPVSQACEYIRQAALGLQHAHEQGLVHRDIKPSNLLVTQPGGVVKILDLGLARLQEPSATSKTRNLTVLAGNSQMLGTPDYLAPEQALDFHGADIRSDIYALGCTLFFLLTGEPPFPGGGLHQKLIRHQQEDPPSLAAARSEVPAGLATIVEKMLSKRPVDRYQTPGEVAQALADLNLPVAESEAPSTVFSVERTPASGVLAMKPTGSTTVHSAVRTALPPPKRSAGPMRWALFGGAGLVLLVGVIGGCWLFSSGPTATVVDAGNTAPAPTTKAVEEKPKAAIEFKGDQLVVLPPDLFRKANQLTVEMWFKTTGHGTLLGYQDKAFPEAKGGHVPILYIGTGGRLHGQFWHGGVKPITTPGKVNDGLWHHVCLVANGPAKKQSLYLDGKHVGDLAGAINHLNMSQNQIGTGRADNRPGAKPGWFAFTGTIAEVRIWYGIRTPEQIVQGMKTPPGPTERDLAAYYPMDELGGDNLMDRSGRGRHVVLGLKGNRNQPTRVAEHPSKP